VRREVETLLRQLVGLRDVTGSGRDAAALDALRQLATLPISVHCLKKTKVALELNRPCWRQSQATEIRNTVASVVRRWRTMFKVETGMADGVSSNSHARRCRNLSMDLEEAAFGQQPRLAIYDHVITVLCHLLRRDSRAAGSLMGGGMATKDFVTRAIQEVKRQETARKNHKLVVPTAALTNGPTT